MTTDVACWVDKLDTMTAGDIADLLRAENVTGLVGFAEDCPIANFLRRHGVVQHVHVGGAYVRWTELATTPGEPFGFQHHVIPIKGGIRQFVMRFDNGDYSDLCRYSQTETRAAIYAQLIAERAKYGLGGAPLMINTLEPSTVGGPV